MYWADIIGILAVLLLVAANGFFVAAEFSLVAVRKSRVAELVAAKRTNATALQRAVDHLDANLAATQLGITISSLALGWIGEPALAHLIEPALSALPTEWVSFGSHAIAVAIAFIIITALHIVLGELAPKSLALQRSEGTALFVVRALGAFTFIFWPAISTLNALGNLVLRVCGLRPGNGEGSTHSPEEIKLLVAASQQAGLIEMTQREVVARALTIGDRRVGDIMTPRREIDWVDADDTQEQMLKTVRECRHEQLLVAHQSIDEPIGMVLKKDLLDQVLDGHAVNPLKAIRELVVVHEATPIFRVLEIFKKSPVRLVVVVDEYGILEGIVTQSDLLEAIAGDIPDIDDEEPDIVTRTDGSLLIDGLMSAHEAFHRLGFTEVPEDRGYHTIAGFALSQLGDLPSVGDSFEYDNWRFEIVDMDGRRIDKILAQKL
jgi:CBS domain containing-hemolysin-like protein